MAVKACAAPQAGKVCGLGDAVTTISTGTGGASGGKADGGDGGVGGGGGPANAPQSMHIAFVMLPTCRSPPV